jgi:hypothetical protein
MHLYQREGGMHQDAASSVAFEYPIAKLGGER